MAAPLDMRLRTPPGYDGLEPPARLLANERFRRGSFQVSLTVEAQDPVRGLRVDPRHWPPPSGWRRKSRRKPAWRRRASMASWR